MSKIQRKPILMTNNRRDSDSHPEFLDTEALLIKFEPLIKSIHRKFMAYNGIFINSADSEDLYNQIVFEFLRLRKNYDPKRGVDFPGYVKMHLQQRVYHFVMKKQKLTQREQIFKGFVAEDSEESCIDSDNLVLNLEDETAGDEFARVECLASMPWDLLTDEQFELAEGILIQQKTVEDIAKSKKVTIKSVKQQFEELCEFLIELYNSNVEESA